MRNILSLTATAIVATSSTHAATLYQDNFDGGLGTGAENLTDNSLGIGGGMTSRSLRGGNHYFEDDGNLQFTTTGNTHYLNRVVAYSDNTFQSTGGFTLTVDYFQTTYAGASQLAFGLISSDTDLSTFSGENPFIDSSTYGFGVTNTSGNFTHTNGSSSTILEDGPALALNANTEVELSFINNGAGGANWSWSVGGVDQSSGTIALFDFSKSFHFVAYGQDDQGNKLINSVSLESTVAVPEPSSSALLGLGGLALILRRRK